jgi:hypothetical protein
MPVGRRPDQDAGAALSDELISLIGIKGHGPHVLDVFKHAHREDPLPGDSEVGGAAALRLAQKRL